MLLAIFVLISKQSGDSLPAQYNASVVLWSIWQATCFDVLCSPKNAN